MFPSFLRPEILPYVSIQMVPALVVICAYCPDFDPTAAANATASHGVCDTCCARLEAELAS